MLCTKCGYETTEKESFCGKCGTKIVSTDFEVENLEGSIVSEVDNPSTKTGFDKSKKVLKIILVILILAIVVAGIIFSIYFFMKPDRKEILLNLDRNKYVKFKLDDQYYYIGDDVSKLNKNKITYDTGFGKDIVYSDSISTRSFYNENKKLLFLGALYCSSKDNCSHNDTMLVKANFYPDSKVVVNEYIKFGMDYDDVVEKYGKEDGIFYQDEELYVWTFGDGEIGDAYMILRFETGGLFSSGGINEIRLGVFWYEGESDHIIEKVRKDRDK